jgi:hypothetical protein
MPTLTERLFAPMGLWLANQIASLISPERIEAMRRRREYYEGVQRKPLKLKAGQADDNLLTNFTALAVDRTNAMLFGGGVEFKLPAGAQSPEAEYLDAVWQANKKSILLNRWGQDGEIHGTAYIKIIPDGIQHDDVKYPRLQLLDPFLMEITVNPMDMDEVLEYVFTVRIGDEMFKEITRRKKADEIIENEGVVEDSTWIVENWETRGQNGVWKLVDSTPWPYDFPPIIHHQNLPSLHSVYGTSGIAGLLEIQDKYNFVSSNMLKIIRYHSHPKTWGRGLPSNASMEKVSWGADELVKIPSETGMLANLEMQSDLASSRVISQDLRQSIFDLARVVDISSIADKAGQLTNFGLRVLYSDALAKNSVRRSLYGDAIQEINRRVLILNSMPGDNDPVWGSDLPSDEADDAKLILDDLNAGLVSRETAAQQRGYHWKTAGEDVGEADKIAQEKADAGQTQTEALANFMAGNTQSMANIMTGNSQ